MDPCLLWVRAAVVGTLAFVLGVVGHATAEGRLPGPVLLTFLLGCCVALSGPLLTRPASRRRLVLLLVGGQSVIHGVLTVTAGHVGDPVRRHAAGPLGDAPYGAGGIADAWGTLPVSGGHRVGSLQDAFALQPGSTADTPLAPALPIGHLVNDLSAHAPMMAAHLAAAVLVGLWLAHGERCLWTVIALSGRRLLLVVLTPLPVLPQRPSLTGYLRDRAPVGPRSRWLSRPHARRGPPLLAA